MREGGRERERGRKRERRISNVQDLCEVLAETGP